jgi:hypothetical protein
MQPEDRTQIIYLFQAGKTRKDIANIAHRDYSTVCNVIKKAGLGASRKEIHKPDIATLKLLERHTVAEVCRMTGESINSISRLKRIGRPRLDFAVQASRKADYVKSRAFLTDKHAESIGEDHASRIIQKRAKTLKGRAIKAMRESSQSWQAEAWAALQGVLCATDKYIGDVYSSR